MFAVSPLFNVSPLLIKLSPAFKTCSNVENMTNVICYFYLRLVFIMIYYNLDIMALQHKSDNIDIIIYTNTLG